MGMSVDDVTILSSICSEINADQGVETLVDVLSNAMAWDGLEYSLNRGNWHRLGGVVDARHEHVAHNLAHWAEHDTGGDIEELVAKYDGAGYLVTRLAGNTHYLTVPVGDDPQDFLQLEVEELCEVIERPLVEEDWFPDTLEEFIDPVDYTRLEPETVGRPYYLFRRVTDIRDLLNEAAQGNRGMMHLARFFNDWKNSSASDGVPFCRRWVLALREYMNSDAECRMTARPVSIQQTQLPDLPGEEILRGAALANAIHAYDRAAGYPFAWFFMMLSQNSENHELAYAVLHDQLGAYDYLPARDLKVLRAWEERPYAV